MTQKQTLFLDVDGVLLDFTGPFADFWNRGLQLNRWIGEPIDNNPKTWSFGYCRGIDDMSEIDRANASFNDEHDHLPLIHPDISEILSDLQNRFTIELVTAYPNQEKRVSNLLHHQLPFDKITCDVHNKLGHIQESEKNGSIVVAIFEDGPHHLEKMMPHYGGKIWAPSRWNYLKPLMTDERIRFYDSPYEWKQL